MAEIDISVMESECLNRRIPDQDILEKEVAVWTKMRNDQKARINWRFTREKAREKSLNGYGKQGRGGKGGRGSGGSGRVLGLWNGPFSSGLLGES